MKKRNYLWFILISIFLSSCNALTQSNKPVLTNKVIHEKKLETILNDKNKEVIPVTKETKEINAFNKFINSENLKYSNVSFYAVNLKNKKVIENYKSSIALTPASVMKIVTSATALEVLKPDGRLETKLVYDGKIDKNHKLIGNLYIVGGGDPTLGSDGIEKKQTEFLNEWVNAIKSKGIKSISGDIIVLDDLFGYEGIPKTWLWEDMGTAYAPGVYGISVFDNLYTIYLKSGKPRTTPKIVKIIPRVKGLKLINNSKVSLRGRRDITVRGVPLNNNRVILGEVPENQEKITIKTDIPDPGLFLGEYFSDYLKKNNVKLLGKVKTSRNTKKRPKNPKVLAVTKSVTISEIVNILLTRSDNHYTESLYQILEKEKGIDIKEYWKEKGIDIGSLTMKDGSGLSRGDTLSTKLLVDILEYMYSQNINFEKLLPIAGKEGTVIEFLKETPLEKKAHIKSGSMSGIQSYAGYVEKGDKKYAFAIIINHWNGNRGKLRKEIETLLNNLF